jgi:hypothetical protein
MHRAEQEKPRSMFPVPPHMLFVGDLEQAREFGKANQKMVLVNLQNYEEFVSHTLDRDIWPNVEIQYLLREYFVFLQLTTPTELGTQFLSFYKEIQVVPVIAIIDSRTGELLHQVSCANDKDTMVEQLTTIGEGAKAQEQQRQLEENQSEQEQQRILYESIQQQRQLQQQQQPQQPQQQPQQPPQQAIVEVQLPPEPDKSDQTACSIVFRLPDGSRVERRFYETCSFGDVMAFVRTKLSPQQKAQLAVMYPKKVFSDESQTLQQSGIGQRATLMVEIIP